MKSALGVAFAGCVFSSCCVEVGLGRFVDEDKADFIGKAALASAPRGRRHWGVACEGEPLIAGEVQADGVTVGHVTAGAMSPYLHHGVGYVLLDEAGLEEGATVTIRCKDGAMCLSKLVDPPFYDKACEIPRGKLVDVPKRS